MTERHADIARPVWERCGCDQWGRCLVNCPTAHLPWRERPIYRRLFGAHSDGSGVPDAD